MSRVQSIFWLLVVIGGGLFCVNLYGQVVAPYERPVQAQNWGMAVAEIDAAWARERANDINRSEFLEVATNRYASAIEYMWPKHKARVAFTDNWILWLMRYFDPVVRKLGMSDVEGLFRAYETVDYRRALARGYGIRSQNSLGFASLLERRYGVETDVIGLDGHVVVEAGGHLLDPSVGLVLPFSLAEAEPREQRAGEVSAIYEASFASEDVTRTYGFNGKLEGATPFSELGKYYDASGNERIEGAVGYRPKLYWFERATDWAKWILPALMVFVGVWGVSARHGNRGRITRA